MRSDNVAQRLERLVKHSAVLSLDLFEFVTCSAVLGTRFARFEQDLSSSLPLP